MENKAFLAGKGGAGEEIPPIKEKSLLSSKQESNGQWRLISNTGSILPLCIGRVPVPESWNACF